MMKNGIKKPGRFVRPGFIKTLKCLLHLHLNKLKRFVHLAANLILPAILFNTHVLPAEHKTACQQTC